MVGSLPLSGHFGSSERGRQFLLNPHAPTQLIRGGWRQPCLTWYNYEQRWHPKEGCQIQPSYWKSPRVGGGLHDSCLMFEFFTWESSFVDFCLLRLDRPVFDPVSLEVLTKRRFERSGVRPRALTTHPNQQLNKQPNMFCLGTHSRNMRRHIFLKKSIHAVTCQMAGCHWEQSPWLWSDIAMSKQNDWADWISCWPHLELTNDVVRWWKQQVIEKAVFFETFVRVRNLVRSIHCHCAGLVGACWSLRLKRSKFFLLTKAVFSVFFRASFFDPWEQNCSSQMKFHEFLVSCVGSRSDSCGKRTDFAEVCVFFNFLSSLNKICCCTQDACSEDCPGTHEG